MFAENESFFTSDSSIGEIQEKYWNRIRHPYVGGMELTPYCNLSCVHCYLQDQNKSKLLSTNQIKTIIDKLFSSNAQKILAISIIFVIYFILGML